MKKMNLQFFAEPAGEGDQKAARQSDVNALQAQLMQAQAAVQQYQFYPAWGKRTADTDNRRLKLRT